LNSRQFYLLGSVSWFFAFGMQGVLFAWLVTMVLGESPINVGFAQIALLLPSTLLLLLGGSLADQYGSRRLLLISQSLSALAPLFLIGVLVFDAISFPAMLVYAVMMGCAQAFVTPARDGLLNEVAGTQVQRTVAQAMLMQFGGQILGFALAGFADTLGPTLVIFFQLSALVLGVFAFRRVIVPARATLQRHRSLVGELTISIIEGGRSVIRSAPMRMVMLQNMAMGSFFMGSYIVTFPILIREVYGGDSSDLALLNITNSLGLVTTIFLLLRFGDVRWQGRALLISQGIGCFMLGAPGVIPGFPALLALIFGWGACGGIAMSMSRTIMQENAPPDQRGRVMAFYSFSFMGSGPLGALLSGFLVTRFGPESALLISSSAMFAIIVCVSALSKLWQVDAAPRPLAELKPVG
jgi:MFS family permease